jgi:hypothetical protein
LSANVPKANDTTGAKPSAPNTPRARGRASAAPTRANSVVCTARSRTLLHNISARRAGSVSRPYKIPMELAVPRPNAPSKTKTAMPTNATVPYSARVKWRVKNGSRKNPAAWTSAAPTP